MVVLGAEVGGGGRGGGRRDGHAGDPGEKKLSYYYKQLQNKVVFISNGCFEGEDSLLTDPPLWPSCKCISDRRALIFLSEVVK